MYNNDTIAALATPPGIGALAIIRISGENLKTLFQKLTKNKKIIIYDLRNLYSPNKITNKNIRYFSVGRG